MPFTSDATKVAALQHPHVLPLYDFWREPGAAYLVSPLVRGETLRDAFLPDSLYQPALELMRGIGPPLVYVDRYFEGVDVYHEPLPRCHAFQAEYLTANPDVIREVDCLGTSPAEAVVRWIGYLLEPGGPTGELVQLGGTQIGKALP